MSRRMHGGKPDITTALPRMRAKNGDDEFLDDVTAYVQAHVRGFLVRSPKRCREHVVQSYEPFSGPEGPPITPGPPSSDDDAWVDAARRSGRCRSPGSRIKHVVGERGSRVHAEEVLPPAPGQPCYALKRSERAAVYPGAVPCPTRTDPRVRRAQGAHTLKVPEHEQSPAGACGGACETAGACMIT